MDPETDLDAPTLLRLPDTCFVDWWLKTGCPPESASVDLCCRVPRYFPIGRKVRRQPLGHVITKLRCKHCGKPPVRVELIDVLDGPGLGWPKFRVRLMGEIG